MTDDEKSQALKKHWAKIHQLCGLRLGISTLIFSIVTGFAINGKNIDQVVAYLKPFTEVFSVAHLLITVAVLLLVYAYLDKLSTKYKKFGMQNTFANKLIRELGDEIPRTFITFGGVVLGVSLVVSYISLDQSEFRMLGFFLFFGVVGAIGFQIIGAHAMFCFSEPEENEKEHVQYQKSQQTPENTANHH